MPEDNKNDVSEKRLVHGKLHLIMGAMFSGKSQELFRQFEPYLAAKKTCLYINSSIDTRTDNEYSTHSSTFSQLDNNENIRKVKTDTIEGILNICVPYDIIGIDEQHFYPDLVVGVKKLVQSGKIVYVAGLSGDFKMELIGEMYKLIGFAEDIIHLKAKCLKCAMTDPPFNFIDAAFSVRKKEVKENVVVVKEGQCVEVGGSDKYYPACRSCWLKA